MPSIGMPTLKADCPTINIWTKNSSASFRRWQSLHSPTLIIFHCGGESSPWWTSIAMQWSWQEVASVATWLVMFLVGRPALRTLPWMQSSTPYSYGIIVTPSDKTSYGKPSVASPPSYSSVGRGASGSIAGLTSKPKSASDCASVLFIGCALFHFPAI